MWAPPEAAWSCAHAQRALRCVKAKCARRDFAWPCGAASLAGRCAGSMPWQRLDRPLYAGQMGSHLHHVIEHHEARLLPAESASVDYDVCQRDAALEASSDVARSGRHALQRTLTATSAARFAQPLHVKRQGGIEGECRFRGGVQPRPRTGLRGQPHHPPLRLAGHSLPTARHSHARGIRQGPGHASA
jgi:hypothetical protein